MVCMAGSRWARPGMGQYLSAPVTEKEIVTGSNDRLRYGISAHQGWRKNMEDAHIAEDLSAEMHLFGVFDGHGGPEVARFCSKRMSSELMGCSGFLEGRYDHGLVQVFHRMDELMRSREGLNELEALRRESEGGGGADAGGDGDTIDMLKKLVQLQQMSGKQNGSGQAGSGGPDAAGPAQPEVTVQAGCTAVVALLVKDRLYVANAGDSRAVLSRGGKALAMSEDHKPAAPDERARIMAAGGFLSEIGGITRVNGNLNLSRAIGDLRYKMNSELDPKDQIITAEPDISCQRLTPEDRFLVLACDGIWDVMNNQQVVDFVSERLGRGMPPHDVSSELLNACLASDPREARGIGCDNMTAAIVVFEPGQPIRSGSCTCSADDSVLAAHGSGAQHSRHTRTSSGGVDSVMREATPPPSAAAAAGKA